MSDDENTVPAAAWQEAMKREAERRGVSLEEFTAHLEKWAEFDLMQVEFMRMGGVEVRGMNQARAVARDGQAVKSGRSAGGSATARERMIDRADNAKEAAEMWDRLAPMPERNRPAVIAQRMGVTPTTVRTWLKATGRKTKGR